jgi:hypothetical protein
MKASRVGWSGLALLGTQLVTVLASAQGVVRAPDAQTAERASARAIADQGFDAFDAGQWRVALDRFERAESLVHSPVHRLFMARCQTNLGLLLEAKETYVAIAREPLPTDAAPALSEAQQSAGGELAALEARIPFVLVDVQPARDGAELVVDMDGQRVPPALVGVPYPINPGRHTWQARAGSRQSALEERVMREGSRETVSLRFVAAPVSGPARPAPATPLIIEPDTSWPWGVIGGFTVGALGAGVGVAFALKKSSLDAAIERTCRPGACPGTAKNLQREDDANRAGLFATVAFIGAGAAMATAVTLLLLDPASRADDHPPSASLEPWLGLGSAGLSGHF